MDGSDSKTGSYLLYKPATFIFETTPTTAVLKSNDKVYQFKKSQFGCAITFDYFITDYGNKHPINKPPIQLAVELEYSNYEINTLWRQIGDQGSKWRKANVYIGENRYDFDLKFIGYYPGGNSTIAIDNINFQNCGTPTPQIQCSNEEFKCETTKTCVSKYSLCDQVSDCGFARNDTYLSWDETKEKCNTLLFDCKFESLSSWNTYCHLTILNSESKSNWTVQEADKRKGNSSIKVLKLTIKN